MERVVDFRTRISGIRPQDLRKGWCHVLTFPLSSTSNLCFFGYTISNSVFESDDYTA